MWRGMGCAGAPVRKGANVVAADVSAKLVEATTGIKVYHYHRTMGEYIRAFADSGFMLRTLARTSAKGKRARRQADALA